MPRKLFWAELNTNEFSKLNPESTIVILPIAAIEQHGPHLPVITDTAINQGMITVLTQSMPDDLNVLVLPIQQIGKSNEHLCYAGTLTFSANLLIQAWTDIGECVARCGFRKLVIINSHGGNVEVMSIVARELRVRHHMLVASTQWRRFGFPPGLLSDAEIRYGIHGGDAETSLMLHFRPELVDMRNAKDFQSETRTFERDYRHLSPVGPHELGWMTQEINREGAIGNASIATAEKGRQIAEHQVAAFIELLRDMTRFPLQSLDNAVGMFAPSNS